MCTECNTNDIKVKLCPSCNETKIIMEFHKDKSKADGLYSICKKCRMEKINTEDNILKRRAYDRNRYYADIEKTREKNRQKYYKNRERSISHSKVWAKKHRKHLNLYSKLREMKNISIRIRHVIMSGVQGSLRGNKNGKHWEDLVGYKLEDLKRYLESMWTQGMTWDTYGKQKGGAWGWEIDHIRPISSFNITSYDCEDFKECWKLENLRPMWATTRIINGVEYLGNRNKHKRYVYEQKKDKE